MSVTATAPAGTTTVALTLAAGVGAASTADWDDASVVDTTLANGGFEDAGPESACPRDWRCDAPGGTRVERTTTAHRTGSAALVLVDSAHDAAATARTSLVQVQPSVGETFTAWYQAKSGEPTPSMTVRWYDAAMEPIGSAGPPSLAPGQGGWRRLDVTHTAPDAAAWATLELSTSEAGTGTVLWDDVSVAPARGAAAQRWDSSPVARLDGFTTTTTSRVVDLRGRRSSSRSCRATPPRSRSPTSRWAPSRTVTGCRASCTAGD